MNLGDILTPFEIDKTLDIWRRDRANFHKRCVQEVCVAACQRRNDLLPDYLAYAIENALTQAENVPKMDAKKRDTLVSDLASRMQKPLGKSRKSHVPKMARKLQSKLP